jgi:hypothetical protein
MVSKVYWLEGRLIAAMLAFFCSSANAAQPSSEQCRAVSKIEYNSS